MHLPSKSKNYRILKKVVGTFRFPSVSSSGRVCTTTGWPFISSRATRKPFSAARSPSFVAGAAPAALDRNVRHRAAQSRLSKPAEV